MNSVCKCLFQSIVAICVGGGLSSLASAQEAEQPGIVRISKPAAQTAANSSLKPVSAQMASASCAPGGAAGPLVHEPVGGPQNGGAGGAASDTTGQTCPAPDGFHSGIGLDNCRPGRFGLAGCANCHDAFMEYLKCKFGYFIPSGGGGRGVPWVGCYARVYPVNPYYRDSRDGQLWAAQGYGLPMAVPLAPVVGHTYDYSWGIPSSRLTPVSNPAY